MKFSEVDLWGDGNFFGGKKLGYETALNFFKNLKLLAKSLMFYGSSKSEEFDADVESESLGLWSL